MSDVTAPPEVRWHRPLLWLAAGYGLVVCDSNEAAAARATPAAAVTAALRVEGGGAPAPAGATRAAGDAGLAAAYQRLRQARTDLAGALRAGRPGGRSGR